MPFGRGEGSVRRAWALDSRKKREEQPELRLLLITLKCKIL